MIIATHEPQATVVWMSYRFILVITPILLFQAMVALGHMSSLERKDKQQHREKQTTAGGHLNRATHRL